MSEWMNGRMQNGARNENKADICPVPGWSRSPVE